MGARVRRRAPRTLSRRPCNGRTGAREHVESVGKARGSRSRPDGGPSLARVAPPWGEAPRTGRPRAAFARRRRRPRAAKAAEALALESELRIDARPGTLHNVAKGLASIVAEEARRLPGLWREIVGPPRE